MEFLISLLIGAGFAAFGNCGEMAMNGHALNEAGHWTEYNSFKDPSIGTIDAETVYTWLNKNTNTNCYLWCEKPMAVRWKPKSKGYYVDSLQQIESCAVIEEISMMSTDGFYCFNFKQQDMNCALNNYANYDEFCQANKLNMESAKNVKRDHHLCDLCPDFEVSFKCQVPKPQQASQCPRFSSKRSQERLLELDEEMKYMEAQKQDIKQRMVEEEKRESQKKSTEVAENTLLRLIKEYLNKHA